MKIAKDLSKQTKPNLKRDLNNNRNKICGGLSYRSRFQTFGGKLKNTR